MDLSIENTGKPTTTALPLMGWPGPNFFALHISALVSLTISLISSVVVFAILRPTCPSFWSRSTGERFVVYLAVSDMMWSICHSMDHIYMLVIKGHPPNDACLTMAYFVATGIMIQALMVMFMALNAFLMVVKEKKLSMGKYDWKVLTGTVLLPFALMVPPAILKWLGPSGGWCVYDKRNEMGRIFAIILGLVNLATIIVSIVCYGFIYLKIKKAATATGNRKNMKSVQVMMKFIAAYIFQWSTHAVYAVWGLIAPEPFALILVMVIVINMGGFYNLVVYTLMKKMGRSVDNNYKRKNAVDNITESNVTEDTSP